MHGNVRIRGPDAPPPGCVVPDIGFRASRPPCSWLVYSEPQADGAKTRRSVPSRRLGRPAKAGSGSRRRDSLMWNDAEFHASREAGGIERGQRHRALPGENADLGLLFGLSHERPLTNAMAEGGGCPCAVVHSS